MVAPGNLGYGGMEREPGLGGRKLSHTEWVNNRVLPYSTGNSIQCPGLDPKGKEYGKECAYV